MIRSLLSLALVGLLLAPATVAQDSFEFRTDFESGQEFRYELAIETKIDAPLEQTTRTEIDYSYRIVDANDDGFTVACRIHRIAVETPETTMAFPAVDGTATPAGFETAIEILEGLEFTYDTSWGFRQVDGIGRLFADFLNRTGSFAGQIGEALGPAIETVLGPVATRALNGGREQEFTTLAFEAGTVVPGQTWENQSGTLLVATTDRTLAIDRFETTAGRRICWTTLQQETRFSGLLALTGYESQSTEGRTAYLANGLPYAGEWRTEMKLPAAAGGRMVQEVELSTFVTPPAIPTEQAEELEQAMIDGELDRAAQIAEAIVAQNPQDAGTWLILSQVRQGLGLETLGEGETTSEGIELFLGSARAFRRFQALAPDQDEDDFGQLVYYNEACSLALGGRTEPAIAALALAIGAGFVDLEHIENDGDLDSLRENEAFQALLGSLGQESRRASQEQIDRLFADHKPFEFDFVLPDLEETTLRLADYRGKVVIVDIWGTWCPPCRREIPHFVKLHEKYGESGLEIVGINYEGVEADEARTRIAKFAAEFGIPYPCLLGDDATREQIPGFRGYPTTLFIDRSGRVRLQLVGYQEMATLEGVVTSLLEEREN